MSVLMENELTLTPCATEAFPPESSRTAQTGLWLNGKALNYSSEVRKMNRSGRHVFLLAEDLAASFIGEQAGGFGQKI